MQLLSGGSGHSWKMNPKRVFFFFSSHWHNKPLRFFFSPPPQCCSPWWGLQDNIHFGKNTRGGGKKNTHHRRFVCAQVVQATHRNMLCDNNQPVGIDTHYQAPSMIAMLRAGTKVGREDMSQRNWRLAGAGSLTFCLVTYSHYRGECGDAPGWYPAFYARSIRLSRPCRSARQSPPQAEKENLQVERKRTHGRSWKTEGRRERERGGGVAAVSAPVLRREEGLRDAMDALVFSALRRRGENGGNITLASPPSRRFLTRPHCVLLPLYLSLSSRPPPAQHQTAALAVFFLFFLFIFFVFLFLAAHSEWLRPQHSNSPDHVAVQLQA